MLTGKCSQSSCSRQVCFWLCNAENVVAINFIGAGNYFRAVGVLLGTAFASCVGSEPSLENVMASGYIAKGLIASLKLTRDT